MTLSHSCAILACSRLLASGVANAAEHTMTRARYAFTSQISARLNWERLLNPGDRSQTGRGDVDLASLGLEYRF